ncbi:MAG TPA: hypothetical protein VHV82_23490 [Sporichthyaceae bacterium]|nr:hypothetical protein [Sporichthyaceae bacterium]
MDECSAGPGSPRADDLLPTGRPPRLGLLVGGLVMAFSVVLSWLDVPLLGDLNLLQLAVAARTLGVAHGGALPWLTLGLAATAGLAACLVPGSVRVVGLVIGAVSLAWVGYLFHDLTDLDSQSLGFASIGSGPYVALSGALAIFVSGLIPT